MLLVGVVRRSHGVSGEVSVEPITNFPDRFAPGLRLLWRCESGERPLTVAASRPHGARRLLRFEEVRDGEAARALAGGDLWVAEHDAVAPPEDFYYGHEIEGWSCEDARGRALGRAAGLEETPSGPILSVATGGREPVLVPFVRPIVVSVDRASRKIVLDPPEGLMDLKPRR